MTPHTQRAVSAPTDATIVYRRNRERMPAHEEEAAGRRARGRAHQLAADDHAPSTAPSCRSRSWNSTTSGLPAADRAVRDAGRRHRDHGARPGDRIGVHADAAGSRVRRRRQRAGVSASLMTGCPGRVRRRRHGAQRAHRHRRRRATARRPPTTSTPGCAARRAARPAKHPIGDVRSRCTCGTSATPRRRQQPELDAGATRRRVSTEVVGGLSAEEATYEAGRCLSCGNCFECDGCLGACPEDAVIKLGVGHRLPVRLRPLHRLRRLLRAVPGTRHRDVRRAEPTMTRATVDGNEAAVSVAYRLNEVCCIYPITPSSPMAELADEWSSARAAQRVGHRPDGGRDAKRGRSGRRAARRPAGRRADHDVHRRRRACC